MIAVELVAGTQRLNLTPGADPESVAPGAVTLLVTGWEGGAARLDGRPIELTAGASGRILSVDLARSTGYHRLTLEGAGSYWFATEDAKARLAGIESMLGYLRDEGFAWGGQLIFSNGESLRDFHVLYGWLDQHADGLVTALELIARKPVVASRAELRTTSHPERPVDIPATLALIRRDPVNSVEPLEGGPIRVGDKTYVPRQVRVRRRAPSIDTPANRRALWVAAQVQAIASEVSANANSNAVRDRCAGWQQRLHAATEYSQLRRLKTIGARQPVGLRAAIERTDARYAVMYATYLSLRDTLSWNATKTAQPLYTFINFADEIYQAFAAYALAKAAGLEPTSASLGLTAPAFEGNGRRLFYNSQPPPEVLRSWRDYSIEPATYRPDLLFVETANHRVVLADAKYRNQGLHATEDSRKELLAYMAAFGLSRVVLVFPPLPLDQLSMRWISYGPRAIGELTVSPVAGLAPFLEAQVPALLEAAACTPRWRAP